MAMKTEELLRRAERNTPFLECSCVGIGQHRWDQLMCNSTHANRKIALKIAYMTGIIDAFTYRKEMKNKYYNPYNHYKTKTHIIYVNSGFEYFIRVPL